MREVNFKPDYISDLDLKKKPTLQTKPSSVKPAHVSDLCTGLKTS